MKSIFNAQTLKMVGGGVIVGGACLILFPDLITYFGGIAKLLIMILFAILSAAFVVRAFYKLKTPKSASEASSQQPAIVPSSSADTTSDT
ncbi:MAG: hypothetical protein HYX67_07265 [Candidatus Melainabacteria bacterium]|nr:hypothetical protein [Candidatus Melainabacteria bacterium]